MIASHLPPTVGVGFKPQHYASITESAGLVGFIEVHAENYMGAGGLPHAMLTRLRADHALSVHGVGLSIGGAQPLDSAHLQRLKQLCDRYQPHSVSEHLAWSTHEGAFFNDLLPLPYTEQTLESVCRHVDQVQSVLGRQMLLENPSTYMCLQQSTIPETDFLRTVATLTGCGLLLDINNLYVSSVNLGLSPEIYLNEFSLEHVRQIHLAGHNRDTDDQGALLLIDAHGSPVVEPVWMLYSQAIAKLGPVATLIEWDNDVPEWRVLRSETECAAMVLDQYHSSSAA